MNSGDVVCLYIYCIAFFAFILRFHRFNAYIYNLNFNPMYTTSPEDVLTIVSKDLKARRLSQEKIAEMTGYKSRQAISLILKSGKYMNATQAKAFHNAFGYYERFLTAGEGSLMSDEPDLQQIAMRDSAIYPDAILNLRPFEDKKSFQKALDRLLDKINLVYGKEKARRLVYLCMCYSDYYFYKKEEDFDRVIQSNRNKRQFIHMTPEEMRKDYQSKEYEEYADERLNHIMNPLYALYTELSEKCI